jgi:TetR/AcrR family transcriptional regulator
MVAEIANKTDANKTDKGQRTRRQILDAAERIFAERGYAAARLEDVAAAVGIRRASIVYYFKDKQELYEAMEVLIYDALVAATEARLAGARSAREKLVRLIDAWLDFMTNRPNVPRLILRTVADAYPVGPNPVKYSGAALGLWEGVVREGQRSGEFKPIDPIHLLHLIGSAILMFGVSAEMVGDERRYNPASPAALEPFRQLLHRSALSAVGMLTAPG